VNSAGFKAGNYAKIKINGKNVLKGTGKRGMNVVGLDPQSHNIILKKAYDTYGDAYASDKMLNDLGKLPNGAVVAIAVKDEATKKLSGKVR